MTFVDADFERSLHSLAVPGLLLEYRRIATGDENGLLTAEAAAMAAAALEQRRASGAARIVARPLLAQLGHPDFAVLKGEGGAPLWPAGVSGSLAHDDHVAVAAVGMTKDIGSVGIDVEPALPLPGEMRDLVMTPQERGRASGDPLEGRLLFAAKEAVYKAVYPRDRVFLEFHDIDVDLAAHKATTRTGRVVSLRYAVAPRILVLAYA